jgi:hypothetical protein
MECIEILFLIKSNVFTVVKPTGAFVIRAKYRKQILFKGLPGVSLHGFQNLMQHSYPERVPTKEQQDLVFVSSRSLRILSSYKSTGKKYRFFF